MSIVSVPNVGPALLPSPGARRTALKQSTLVFEHHEKELSSVEFSPDGKQIATASWDKNILIYRFYADDMPSMKMSGHLNAILELHWASDGLSILSCSADKSLAQWDVETGERIKKYRGHREIINSCRQSLTGIPIGISGGDDGTTKVWDFRTRKCVQNYEHSFQIISVTMDETSNRIFAGTLDDKIRIYDLRMAGDDDVEPLEVITGHTDSVTGLDISPNKSFLLSNSMDNTIKKWDIRTSSTERRCEAVYRGATNNFEKAHLRVRVSPDGTLCSAGSADRMLNIWEMSSGQIVYKLPGQQGTIHETAFHPREPIVASVGADKRLFVRELGL